MFRRYVLMVGVMCILVTILNAFFGFWVVGILVLVGFLYALFKDISAGLFLAAVAIGNMPMDGSWVLWGLTIFASLGLGLLAAVTLYEKQVPSRCDCRPGLGRVLASLALPIIGLCLVQYLVETDRSVVSGLILMAILVGIGWKLAPRTIIVSPVCRFSPPIPRKDVNPVGQRVDFKI